MSRLALVIISVLVGSVLAVAVAFTVTGTVANAKPQPVQQQLYNYGAP
jgi:ABC-type arginine/histidine transport system permease subunit